MQQLNPIGNVNELLKELHTKKKWLDKVIAGIESALDSPQYQLIALAEEAFNQDRKTPKVDLKDGRHFDLEKLAETVGGRRRALRRRGDKNGAGRRPNESAPH